jgi:hypothetical protein
MPNKEKLSQVQKLLKPSENQVDRSPDSYALALLAEVVISHENALTSAPAPAPAPKAAKAKAAKDNGK